MDCWGCPYSEDCISDNNCKLKEEEKAKTKKVNKMHRIIVIFNDGAKVEGVTYFTREECQAQIDAYRNVRPDDEETWGFRLEIEEVE